MVRRRCVGWVAAAVAAVAGLAAAPSAAGAAQAGTAAAGQAVTLTGTYVEVHGDSKSGDQTLHFLKTPEREYELRTVADPNLPSMSRVSVTGRLTGDVVDASALGAIRMTASAAPRPAVVGTQQVLVINVAWPGSSLTATQVQELAFVFGADWRTLASYYADASYGQLTWAGSVTPTYTIADPAGCNLAGLANAAESAATADGYGVSSYRALMINAPALYCGAAGYGEIGGNHTWIENGLWNLDDGYARLVPTHEIGHSLGLYHSHGLECGTATITSACLSNPFAANEEYGNAWDVMGNNWPGDGSDAVTWFSAKQEILLGWLTGSRVKAVSTSGTYSLVPLEKSGTTSAQVLVLTTPAHTYYVEYRQPIGQDAFMSGYPAATNSVHINVTAPLGADTGPFALDFTPGSNATPGYYDWFDAPLAIGGSFTDPENTFMISPLSQNGTTASVRVTFLAGARSEEEAVTFGGWAPLSDAAGTYRASAVKKDVAKFTFSGTGVTWLTKKGPAQGIASVTIDGVSMGTRDTYAAAPSSASFSFTGLADASHTMVIKVSGTRNAASSGTSVAVDGFTVGTVTTQETAPKVLLFTTWKGVKAAAASGGSYRLSGTAGAAVSFTFTGTAVDWITAVGPGWGNAQVSIDGVVRGTVDLYAPSAHFQTAFTYAGLTAGRHTITVTALGTRNPAATKTSVCVDAFVVR